MLHRDAENRLHCADGAAIAYPDGWGVWVWHGVRVPQRIIEHADQLTAAEILALSNVEVRRAVIERIGGPKALIERAGDACQVVDADTDALGLPRRLLRLHLPDDDTLLMVQVTNSTPEPDGSRKTYYLHVDAECRPLLGDDRRGKPQALTCAAAVAASFGMREAEYARLGVET